MTKRPNSVHLIIKSGARLNEKELDHIHATAGSLTSLPYRDWKSTIKRRHPMHAIKHLGAGHRRYDILKPFQGLIAQIEVIRQGDPNEGSR